MNYHDIIVSRDELQILVNMLEDVSLMYPLYSHFQILTAVHSEGFRLRVLIGEYDFDKQVEELGELGKEMPEYADLLECMLSSGVIRYENEDAFRQKVKRYRSLQKKVYYCPDTNILYHQFLSNFGLEDDLLLVDTVKEEVEGALNYKYSPNQISELKKVVKYQNFLLDEWVNKRMKRSRKARIALRECKRVRDKALEVEGLKGLLGIVRRMTG
ncbi:MAG: hypothetical protein ACOC5L_04535 [Halobacteriota archaeon]